MSRKRKNAGEGYGYMFSGAFSEKKDAVKKERARKGSFIKGMPTAHGYRYVVMTPRDNPIKRRARNISRGFFSEKIQAGAGQKIVIWATTKAGPFHVQPWVGNGEIPGREIGKYKTLERARHEAGKYIEREWGGAHNPMELAIMGANPAREIVVRPGEHITITAAGFRHNPIVNPAFSNPSSEICGKTIGGLPCTREKGHRGPHLPQGATLRPSSRHNWGRPNPTAEETREAFVGRPVDRVDTYREPHMPAIETAQLGRALALYVKPLSGGQVQIIDLLGDGVKLTAEWISPENRRDRREWQLWFVGGRQDITGELENFGARESGVSVWELGEARRIDYKQRKEHVPDPDVDEWQHHFGEENGIRPQVFFDARAKRLLLEGGDYRIESRGIIN